MAIDRAGNTTDRAILYLNRAEDDLVFGRPLAFYPGEPTIPNSFTGNLALGANTNGPGAFLLDGIGPPIEIPLDCDEPIIIIDSVVIGDDNLFITVQFSNIEGDDIFVLFGSNGVAYSPSNVQATEDGWQLTFPDPDLIPPGVYNLKVIREGNLECFAISYGVYTQVAPACDIEVTDMVGDGVFPNPPLSPGDTDATVTISGSGFLSGPLTVTITPFFGGPNPLNVDSVAVGDDNTLTVQFDADPFQTGTYGVRVELTSDPTCFGEIGFDFGEPQISVLIF